MLEHEGRWWPEEAEWKRSPLLDSEKEVSHFSASEGNLSSYTQRREDCGEELCWDVSLLAQQNQLGKDRKLKLWLVGVTVWFVCRSQTRVEKVKLMHNKSKLSETCWRRRKIKSIHFYLSYTLYWPSYCQKRAPSPLLPCPAVCLAHMMQLEFQMLFMEFCSISGLQMWLSPHSSFISSLSSPSLHHLPKKILVTPLPSPSSPKHCRKVETNWRP